MLRGIRVFFILAFVISATAVFAQEDFSADMVTQHDGKPMPTGKIYATKDKMRFEGQDKGSRAGGAVVVNFTTQTSAVLMAERKMYMEMPLGQGPSGGARPYFFRPKDVSDACSEWVQQAMNKGGTCKKIGSATVNGRSTVEYEGTNAKGETSQVWLDDKIAFPIKWQSQNGGGELQNIKEGSQPASLFEIPSDYQKFQMPAGMPGMPGAPSPH